MNLFEAVGNDLRVEGFMPGVHAFKRGRGVTLFDAVRRVHGMDPDTADVCFWDWRALRAHLEQVWQTLDEAASVLAGTRIQAVAWAYAAERTLDEIVQLLTLAGNARPDLDAVQALPRPQASGMVAGNKPRGAIANTLGVLHAAGGLPFGAQLDQVLAMVPADASNEVLLDHLDQMAVSADAIPGDCGTSLIPRVLSRYFNEGLEPDGAYQWKTFAGFLEFLAGNERTLLSDDELYAWLLRRSPEPVVVPRRASAPNAFVWRDFDLQEPVAGIGAGRSFAAFDVETANAHRESICAVGVVLVDDGQVTDKFNWLVQPPPGFQEFRSFNIGIHGIRSADVAHAPNFADLIPEFVNVLGARPVLAHNASFDIGALRLACLATGTPMPTFHYSCTMALSRAFLQLPSYGLHWCADVLGVPVGRHHDAADDAEASARIALALLEREQVDGLDALLQRCRIRWGLLSEIEWMRSWQQRPKGQAQSTGRNVSPPNPNADPSHPLYGCSVALTGDLVVMTRQRAFDRLSELGAYAQANVTRDTQILVVGDQNPAMLRPGAEHSKKLEKAFARQADGQQIEVMSAYDFVGLMD